MNEKKHSKCKDCKLDCQFRGRESFPKIKELVKVPEECNHRKEIQKSAALMATNLSKHVAALNQALITAQQMRVSIISQQQIKVIIEINKYYQQQMRAVAESVARFSEFARSAELLSTIESYKSLQPYLESARNIASLISMSTLMYFTSKELSVLERPIRVPK